MRRVAAFEIECCAHCKTGRWRVVEHLPADRNALICIARTVLRPACRSPPWRLRALSRCWPVVRAPHAAGVPARAARRTDRRPATQAITACIAPAMPSSPLLPRLPAPPSCKRSLPEHPAETYTAHPPPCRAVQSDEVYLTPCTTSASFSSASASDKRYSFSRHTQAPWPSGNSMSPSCPVGVFCLGARKMGTTGHRCPKR